MVVIQRWRKQLADTKPELFRFGLLEQFSELEHGISTRQSEALQRWDAQAAQPHGNKFALVAAKAAGRAAPKIFPKVDALITSQARLRLRIGTSDCVPIIVYDPVLKRGGVIHAGMKGTTQNILLNVLDQFNARQVWLGIGPAVGRECYDGIDLQIENILQAKAAGVPLEQIEVMRWCTHCHSDRFFSYRAGDRQNFGTYFRLAKS